MVVKMKQMKDSGAKWIGKIPTHWKSDKLKYHLQRKEPKNPGDMMVLSLYRELGVIPKDSRDDNHNMTSEDTSKYKYVKPGNFVVNKMKAWQGSVAVSNYEGIVSPAYYVYEFSDNLYYKRYFHYLLRGCYKDEFMRLSGGMRVGQWDLSSEDLDNTLVIIPPIDEQKCIAEFLDKKCEEVDGLIADILTQIDTLEQYKRSTITEAVTKGLNPTVEMKDCELEWASKIPAHWEVVPNKYLMAKKKIIQPIYKGEDILSLTVNGVIKRDLENPSGKMPTSFDGYQVVYPNNLLMCLFDIDVTPRCVGAVKDYGLTSPAYSQFILNEKADTNYYYYYYLSLDFTKELLHLAKNQRHSLNEEQFGAIKAVVPPIDEQEAIAEYLDKKCAEIDACIDEKKQQISVLENYKKSIIFEYVTGKKEVI